MRAVTLLLLAACEPPIPPPPAPLGAPAILFAQDFGSIYRFADQDGNGTFDGRGEQAVFFAGATDAVVIDANTVLAATPTQLVWVQGSESHVFYGGEPGYAYSSLTSGPGGAFFAIATPPSGAVMAAYFHDNDGDGTADAPGEAFRFVTLDRFAVSRITI